MSKRAKERERKKRERVIVRERERERERVHKVADGGLLKDETDEIGLTYEEGFKLGKEGCLKVTEEGREIICVFLLTSSLTCGLIDKALTNPGK